jgi:hypothetical protein
VARANCVAIQPQIITIGRVNIFTRVMALLMLAFWLPAVTVCADKCASFAPDDLCCPESAGHSSNQPASPDSNCIFSHVLTKIHDEERVAGDVSLLSAIVQPLFSIVPRAEPLRRAASQDFVQAFSQEWQFITRTALPPRAPSSLS